MRFLLINTQMFGSDLDIFLYVIARIGCKELYTRCVSAKRVFLVTNPRARFLNCLYSCSCLVMKIVKQMWFRGKMVA